MKAKRTNRLVCLIIALTCLCGRSGLANEKESEKPRSRKQVISIPPFTNTALNIPKDIDLGKKVAELLTIKLVNSRRFEVVERQRLKDLIAERGWQGIDDFSSLEDTDGVVMGSVTRYDVEREVEKVIFGQKTTTICAVEITFRIVDVNTSRNIFAEQVIGRARRERKHTNGDVHIPFSIPYGGIMEEGLKLLERGKKQRISEDGIIFAEATQDAIDVLVARIKEAFPLIGTVRLKSEDSVTMDLGSKDGVVKDDYFDVFRSGEEVTNEAGEGIGTDKDEIGQIMVTNVIGPHLAKATIIKGAEKIAEGDEVRSTVRSNGGAGGDGGEDTVTTGDGGNKGVEPGSKDEDIPPVEVPENQALIVKVWMVKGPIFQPDKYFAVIKKGLKAGLYNGQRIYFVRAMKIEDPQNGETIRHNMTLAKGKIEYVKRETAEVKIEKRQNGYHRKDVRVGDFVVW